MTDSVDKVIIESEVKGASETASDLKKIEDGLGGITVQSDSVEKSTTSLEGKFSSLERRLQTTAGQQAQYEKIQKQVNAAVAQNPALQERANAVLEAAAAKFTAGGIAAKDSAKELGHIDEIAAVLESRMSGLGNSMGLISQTLQLIGPVGLAAAAGLGAIAVAMNYLSEQANKFGESSIAITHLATSAGLTTTEVRGLSEAAEKVGISGDSITSSFERFTANLDSARDGTGALFDSIAKINPALAVELAATRSSADAWDILAKAVRGASDATQRAALAKAAGGREGVANVPVLIATDQAGGIKSYSEEVQKATGITDELTKHTALLKAEIDATKKLTANVYASIYSDDVLERQAKFEKTQLSIAQSIKQSIEGAKANGGGPSADEFGNPFDFTLLNQNKAAAAASSETGGAGNTEALKAADSATKELTQSTSLLRAAQIKADEAARSLAQAEASGAASAETVASARKAAGDALGVLSNVEKQRITDLSGAATASEILAQKVDELTAKFQQGTITAETYNRALNTDSVRAAQQVTAIAAAWGGVSEKTALALQAAQNQLPVIQAITGAQQQAAQYAADYTNAVIAGAPALDAEALAASKLAASQAAATTAVEKQIEALKDSTKMIKAQQDGTEATTAAGIAYKNAIASGADETSAAALKSATLANYMAKTATSARQTAESMAAAAMDAQNYSNYIAASNNPLMIGGGNTGGYTPTSPPGSFLPGTMPQGPLSFSANPNLNVSYRQGGTGMRLDTGTIVRDLSSMNSGNVASSYVSKGDYAGAIQAIESLKATSGGTNRDGSPITGGITADAQMSQVDTLTQLLNSQTSDKGAQLSNLQKEMAWLNTLPETIARDQKIVSLQQSIDQLKNSTDGLNGTMSDLLSPYYNQDPRTSHIGFRSQGMASGGEVTVPGGYSANDNMLASIPVASGEIIAVRRPGQSSGGSSQTIQINNHIVVGDRADKNEIGRTVYQAVQNASKQFRAVAQ